MSSRSVMNTFRIQKYLLIFNSANETLELHPPFIALAAACRATAITTRPENTLYLQSYY